MVVIARRTNELRLILLHACTLTVRSFACLCCSRTFINDTPVAFDPERAMAELVLHTHYLPRHWRGRAHSAEVQQSVNSMFTLKVCAGFSLWNFALLLI